MWVDTSRSNPDTFGTTFVGVDNFLSIQGVTPLTRRCRDLTLRETLPGPPSTAGTHPTQDSSATHRASLDGSSMPLRGETQAKTSSWGISPPSLLYSTQEGLSSPSFSARFFRRHFLTRSTALALSLSRFLCLQSRVAARAFSGFLALYLAVVSLSV